MKTYRITEKEIKGMKPKAVGYKIFRNDWTSNQGYDYKDENGNVLGTIHKVDGELAECQWWQQHLGCIKMRGYIKVYFLLQQIR